MDNSNNLTALGRSLSSYNIQSPDKINQLKSRLQVGQLVKGRVIDIMPGGKYLFRLQGLNLIAKSTMMFTTGSVVFAYVSKIFPKLVLKWAEGKNKNVRLKKGLKELGIDSTISNMLLADAILDSDLPLNSDLFNSVIESVSGKLDGTESKESIQQAITQLIKEHGAMETTASTSMEKKDANSVTVIHNNLQLFMGQLSLAGLQEDVNIKFILNFISRWNSITSIQYVSDSASLLPRMGLRHEADIYRNIKKGALKLSGKERNLKSSFIGIRYRLITLIKRGYKISLLNKLLTSADNIIEELDALALEDKKGLGIAGLIPPISRHDGGTLLWKKREEIEGENEWSMKLEMNFEPFGYTEVELTKNSGWVKLDFNLHAEHSKELVSENVELLEKKLEKLDLKVKEINIKGIGLKQ